MAGFGANTAQPIMQLVSEMASKAEQVFAPFKDDITTAKRSADNALLNVGSVEDGLAAAKRDISSNTNGLGTVEQGVKRQELDLGRVTRTADELKDRQIELFRTTGTLDERLQADVANLKKTELDAISAKRTASLADAASKKNASSIGGLVADVKKIGGDVANVGRRVGDLGLKVLDVVDRVANIFNLLATLGTAIRMEQIANNSKARDAELQNKINSLTNQLSDIINSLKNAIGRISTNENDIDSLEAQLVGIDSSLNALLTNTAALLRGQGSIVSTINQSTGTITNSVNQVGRKVDTSIGQNTKILRDTDVIIDITNGIPNRIIPQIRPQVCLALKDPNCNSGGGSNNNVDLSSIERALNEILSKLGIIPFNCETAQPNNGFYNSISQALQSVVCGGGDGANEALEELLDEKDRTDEILEALKDLPEPFLFVPNSWKNTVAPSRPQLIAGMYEKKDGVLSPSKWDICLPYPVSNIESFTVEELAAYFPDYRRGKYYARALLNEGSSFMVHAVSIAEAETYLNRLLPLIQQDKLPQSDFISTGRNPRVSKEVDVHVGALGYYSEGRRGAERVTKRWYLEQD